MVGIVHSDRSKTTVSFFLCLFTFILVVVYMFPFSRYERVKSSKCLVFCLNKGFVVWLQTMNIYFFCSVFFCARHRVVSLVMNTFLFSTTEATRLMVFEFL